MSRRVILIIAGTLALFAASVVVTAVELARWDRIGWLGVSAVVDPPSQKGAKKTGTRLYSGRVMFVYPRGPASDAGLKTGDQILTIEGIPIEDRVRLEQLDRRLKTGDVVTFRVRRGDQQLSVPLRFRSPLRTRTEVMSLSTAALVALCYLAIGLLVFTRKPDDMRVIVFHAMSTMAAVSLIIAYAFQYTSSGARGIVFGTQNLVAVGLLFLFGMSVFPLTLHLALIFPKDRPIVGKRPYVIRWIYSLAIGAALILLVFVTAVQMVDSQFARGAGSAFGRTLATAATVIAVAGLLVALRVAYIGRREGTKNAFVKRPLQTLFAFFAALESCVILMRLGGIGAAAVVVLLICVLLLVLFVISYPVLTCIALYRSYRDANAEEKRQVKWPLWGTIIALVAKIVITTATIILSTLLAVDSELMQRWFTLVEVGAIIPRFVSLLIPISFAFAILKYRLMNIDIIIKKTVAYGILSGAVIFLYLVLVGGLGTILVNVAGVQNQTMVIASTLVVALLFVPLRNKLQFLVDRNLFRQKYDYPQALRAISNETLTATDLIAFLNSSAEMIQQALQNRAVVIFARRQDEFVATAKIGLPDKVLGSLRMDAPSAEAVDRALDPRRKQLPAPAADALRSIEASFVVPVRSHGALHALVALAPKLSDREFDIEDLEFLSSAADQIAIAIDRIRLRFEEQDFEQARVMQQALLPAAAPEVAGLDISGTWHPARAVGGDYYDLLELSATKAGICIGDVAGKGMPAALMMSALQAAVRASATDDVQPKELCERVRRVVVPSLAGGRFVTFFFCTIDMTSRRLLYCNAGHNPPILVRSTGESIRLSTGGSVLSRLFRHEPFVQGDAELRDGDRIVLFTDGVSEARDAGGTDYGEQRLEELIAANRTLGARELITAILDDVTSFSGGRTDDDVTIVAVAVTQPA